MNINFHLNQVQDILMLTQGKMYDPQQMTPASKLPLEYMSDHFSDPTYIMQVLYDAYNVKENDNGLFFRQLLLLNDIVLEVHQVSRLVAEVMWHEAVKNKTKTFAKIAICLNLPPFGCLLTLLYYLVLFKKEELCFSSECINSRDYLYNAVPFRPTFIIPISLVITEQE